MQTREREGLLLFAQMTKTELDKFAALEKKFPKNKAARKSAVALFDNKFRGRCFSLWSHGHKGEGLELVRVDGFRLEYYYNGDIENLEWNLIVVFSRLELGTWRAGYGEALEKHLYASDARYVDRFAPGFKEVPASVFSPKVKALRALSNC